MMKEEKLKEYTEKRDLRKSPEPAAKKKSSNGKPIFVIQKHDASSLHYDFRLEIDGTLKSWAVPKGPSLDPSEKRLAMETEDHPLDYAKFEGVIPEDEYGGGTVIVWDTGKFENIKEDEEGKKISLEDCYKNGQIEVKLNGKKLEGGYALVRTGGKKEKRWLLIKMDDEHADKRRNPVSTEPKSVLSDKTIEEVREAVEGKE